MTDRGYGAAGPKPEAQSREPSFTTKATKITKH